MIDMIYGAVYSIVVSIIVYNFASIFLKEKRKHHFTQLLFILMITMNVVASHVFNNNLLVKACVIIAIHTVCIHFIFRSSAVKSIVINVIYYAIGFLVDTITLLVGVLCVDGIDFQTIGNSPVGVFLGSCSLAIQVAIVVTLHFIFGRKINKKLYFKYFTRTLGFSVFSIISNIGFLINYSSAYSVQTTYIFLFVCLGFVFMNIIMFMILWDVYYNDINTRELLIQNEKNNYLNQVYEHVTDKYNTQKKNEHDINKHLAIMSKLANENDIEQLKTYLTEYGNELNRDVIKSGNSIIDAIINSKYSEMLDKTITPIMNIKVTKNLLLKNVELTSVLSNLIDNAIEACEKIKDNRYIKIFIDGSESSMNIVIINSFSGEVRANKDRLETTKNNSDEHGIGLGNVKEIVEKYNGCLDYTYSDKEFKVNILI